ncbi:UNVERIFIED_CONTAM: hypothetical protein FKN15_053896 [Acipenser sinensis]
MCPYEDPLFVQAFDWGEVEEWIHLKAVPSPQVDQDTCLTFLKGEEWCFAVGKVGHISPNQPPPWQEVELSDLKKNKGRSGWPWKKGKKPAQGPVPKMVKPERPLPKRMDPKRPAPKRVEPEKGKPKRGRWDGYFHLVKALSWCPSCGEGGHSIINCPHPGKEEEG